MTDIEYRNLTFRLLAEIQKHFGISYECVTYMEYRLTHSRHCIFEDPSLLEYDLYTELNCEYIGTVLPQEHFQISHVFFHPPVKTQIVQPFVCLYRYRDIERFHLSLVHELTHLLSSKWEILGTTARLSSGFITHDYEYSCSNILLRSAYGSDTRFNELATDLIACFIASCIFPDYSFQTLSESNPLKEMLKAISIKQMGKVYFENKYTTLLDTIQKNEFHCQNYEISV